MTAVVLIDPDEGWRRLAAHHLRHAGYEVIAVDNGRDGLWQLNLRRIDLVITELVMPSMDGIEVLRGVLSRRAAIPVIAISAGGSYLDRGRILFTASRLGASGLLPKPYRPFELKRVVAACLASSAYGQTDADKALAESGLGELVPGSPRLPN